MNNSLDDVSAKSTQKMAEKEVVEWYSSLPDESRMKLQREFDLLYDNSGCRETKFLNGSIPPEAQILEQARSERLACRLHMHCVWSTKN